MSMFMRQLINLPSQSNKSASNIQYSNDQQQIIKYDTIRNLMDESIKYAKESLQLDMKDGLSWYLLANCYVASFFSPFVKQNSNTNSNQLKQAISAYNLGIFLGYKNC